MAVGTRRDGTGRDGTRVPRATIDFRASFDDSFPIPGGFALLARSPYRRMYGSSFLTHYPRLFDICTRLGGTATRRQPRPFMQGTFERESQGDVTQRSNISWQLELSRVSFGVLLYHLSLNSSTVNG